MLHKLSGGFPHAAPWHQSSDSMIRQVAAQEVELVGPTRWVEVAPELEGPNSKNNNSAKQVSADAFAMIMGLTIGTSMMLS
jgi:hypothetical protein